MSQFAYEARNAHGDLINGIVNAESMDEAGRILSSRGQFVIKLAPAGDHDAGERRSQFHNAGRGVRRKEVMWFMSQLSIMIEAGVPLSEALECLARQDVSDAFAEVLDGVLQSVQEGRPLSDSMEMYPRAFPSVVTALVRASEMSGTMSMILQRIADYLIKEDQMRSRIRGALLYPAVMFSVCSGVTIFLLVVILPRFESIFTKRGATLPAPTRALMATSGVLIDHWMWWIGGVLALLAGVHLWRGTRGGQARWDWLMLHLPLVGGLLRQAYQGRAYHTISTLTEAGVPLTDTLEMTERSAGNVHYARLWHDVAATVRNGERLAGPLLASPLVPEPVAQMIDSGDRSARLGKVFRRLAEILEEEYAQSARTLTQMIEPLMIMVMGSIIGFVAIALLMPMFSAANVIAGK